MAFCHPFFNVVPLSSSNETSAKSWLFSSRFSMSWFENARKCQETRKKVQRVTKQIFKEDYLRFLSRVIGDENHFPTNKTLVWGAYIDQLLMPDNFAFMGWKNFISKKWPKMAFFGIFQLAIGISQPLPTLIFTLWYSLPTLIPPFQKMPFSAIFY